MLQRQRELLCILNCCKKLNFHDFVPLKLHALEIESYENLSPQFLCCFQLYISISICGFKFLRLTPAHELHKIKVNEAHGP